MMTRIRLQPTCVLCANRPVFTKTRAAGCCCALVSTLRHTAPTRVNWLELVVMPLREKKKHLDNEKPNFLFIYFLNSPYAYITPLPLLLRSLALRKPLIWFRAIFCLADFKTMLCFSACRCLFFFMVTGHGAGVQAGGLLPCYYVMPKCYVNRGSWK